MDFTCIIQQNGSTVTSTTTSAAFFIDAAGECTAEVLLAITGAGTVGTVAKLTPTGLPAPKTSTMLCRGRFAYTDASVPTVYTGVARWDGADILLRVHNGSADLGSTPSFALANGDSVQVTLTFQVA